jgi:prepilin signal peptidase PulO-like enzyme (type II secretory pathway)
MGPGLIDSLLQGLIGTGVCIPFFIIWLISRGRLIGLGDILIMALIGLHLGLSLGGSAVLLAFWTGSIFGIFFIMYQKIIYNKDYSQIRTIPVPFGPFLIISWLFTYMHQFNILSLFL